MPMLRPHFFELQSCHSYNPVTKLYSLVPAGGRIVFQSSFILMTIQLLAAGLTSLFRTVLFFRCSPDQPPNDDTEQRADKSRDQVLKGDLDLRQMEIDVE